MSCTGKKGFNKKRVVVAAVFLPILFLYVYYLPPMPFFLLLLIIVGMITMYEFYSMYKVPAALSVSAVLVGGALFYLFCLHPLFYLEGISAGLFVLLCLRLLITKKPSGSMSDLGPIGIGLFYISGFLSFQWFIRAEDSGLKYIFLLYASVWLADSMAYYIGKYLGKNKLYPSVSPNKTIEGAVGSVLGGIFGSVLIKIIMEISDLTLTAAVMTGGVLGVATLTGDLIESMFKRDAGVKDSSGLIPGHGGLLDKLDGMLVAAPILYFIVRFL